MSASIMNVPDNNFLSESGEMGNDVLSQSYKKNKKTGTWISRETRTDGATGTTVIKSVTPSDVHIGTVIQFPQFDSKDKEREEAIIKDMYKNKIKQEDIAATLDISQSKVSRVLRKGKKA